MQKFAAQIADSDDKPWRTLRLVFFCVLIRRELLQEILTYKLIIRGVEEMKYRIKEKEAFRIVAAYFRA